MEGFEAAVRHVRGLPAAGSGAAGAPSAAQRLQFYALYKQAAKGEARGARPGLLDPVGRAKYDAWAGLRGMPAGEARAQYVKLLRKLDASFRMPRDEPATAALAPQAPDTGHSSTGAAEGGRKGRGLARGESIRAHDLEVSGEASVEPGRLAARALHVAPPRPGRGGEEEDTHGEAGAGAGASGESAAASMLAATLADLQGGVQKNLQAITQRLDSVEAEVAALRSVTSPSPPGHRQYEVLGMPLGTALFVACWPVLCYSLWGGRLGESFSRRRA